MKYTAINELKYFDFHHTGVEDISFSDNEMRWKVFQLKVPVNPSGNPLNEVTYFTGSAEIIFENVQIEKVYFPSGGDYVYQSSEYEQVFKTWEELYRVDELVTLDIDKYRITMTTFANGIAGIQRLTMEFSRSVVRWDRFEKKFCYENDEWGIKIIKDMPDDGN